MESCENDLGNIAVRKVRFKKWGSNIESVEMTWKVVKCYGVLWSVVECCG